ncbi:MAG: hypothetical protein FWC89_11340 [Defluviitaleaceae bacterium]|nr:hypothetical protein [Defluviitaleaceae bacterium]
MLHAKKAIAILILILLMGLAACGDTNDRHETDYPEPPVDEMPNLQDEQDAMDWIRYPIIINGVGFTDNFFIMDGEIFPTHVPLSVVYALGLDTIQGGSQIAIQQDGEFIAGLSVLNYLAFGDDRVEIGAHDTFMSDDGYFGIYVPISLFRELGFAAYSIGEHVYIYEHYYPDC